MKGNCEELAQEIEALAAETTGLSSKAAEHVQSCRICREKIESLRAIAAIHRDAASNMPEPRRRLSRQQLESALAEGGWPAKYLGVHWRPILAGVVALALIVGGALTHQTMRQRASAQHQSKEEQHEPKVVEGVVEPTMLALRQEVEAGREQLLAVITTARIRHYRVKDVETELRN